MVQTEGKLRETVVPPLATLMIYLTVTRSFIWVAGVVVTAALIARGESRPEG
jgi:hypothetical protein